MKRCDQCKELYEDNTQYCVLCGSPLVKVELPPPDTPTWKVAHKIVESKTLTSWFLSGKMEAVIKIIVTIIAGILMFTGVGLIPLILLVIASEIYQHYKKK